MAYFARKLAYCAHDDGEGGGAWFFALVELAKKKGGRPVGFFLYRYVIAYDSKNPPEITMIRLTQPKSAEKAMSYVPWAEAGKFPGWQSPLWEKTTRWLYCVALGRWDDYSRKGTWTRVVMPSPWSRRRKKKVLQFGNPAHRLSIRENIIRQLKAREKELEGRLDELVLRDANARSMFLVSENRRAYALLDEEREALSLEIRGLEMEVLNIKDELRFVLARKTGRPYIPRDYRTGFLCEAA